MTAVASWHERPKDEAALLNPVFLALLMGRVSDGHRRRVGSGVSWPLLFVALPAVLHKATRDALPSSVAASMARWTQSHPLAVAALPARAVSLSPLLKEALAFGLAHDVVTHEAGSIFAGRLRRRTQAMRWREPTEDFKDCMQRAEFFGRWIAGSGTPATVLALWGVRP